MIVRIMGEGQYEIDADGAETLDRLDHKIFAAIESDDEAGYMAAVAEAIDTVRNLGTRLDVETIVPSDLTLPSPHSTLAEVRELLSSDDT